jgi:CDP-6-deoxy-D-xylo-4-hexulose-3-dehydrase
MQHEELKQEILRLTRLYSQLRHAANLPGEHHRKTPFAVGDTIPYAARVFSEDEVEAAVSATLDFWLTLGSEGHAFEEELAGFLGVRQTILTNSGSSANLLAVSALTSHKLPPDRRLRPGDEVITVAAGFPVTVAPIVQVGAIPVFIDSHLETANVDCSRLEAARTPRTRAVMIAHALGNPFNLAEIVAFCHQHGLWLVEDNCDALGCSYTLPVDLAESIGLEHLVKAARKRAADGTPGFPAIEGGMLTAWTGSFGDLSTQSFYPPHHLTMGEGGAVSVIRRPQFRTIIESFRDWGRDCWCPSGQDNTCGKRYDWQFDGLPDAYDHKYVYSHLGFNLKPLDVQAAIGRVQLRRLPDFIEARKRNWEALRRGLADLEHVFQFVLPSHATAWLPPATPAAPLTSQFAWDATGCRTECSWFGFMMTVRPDAAFTRADLVRHLEKERVGNRMLFGGNLVRQPAFAQLAKDNPDAMRVVGSLDVADRIMHDTLFLGTYPGLSPAMIAHEIAVIRNFVTSRQ